MNELYEAQIRKKFPNLFPKDPPYYEMAIGDGWKKLIDFFCEQISINDPDNKILSIKEKWGGLTIYMAKASDSYSMLWNMVERLSFHICEECGDPGKLREDLSWLKTLCNKHYEERKNNETIFSK